MKKLILAASLLFSLAANCLAADTDPTLTAPVAPTAAASTPTRTEPQPSLDLPAGAVMRTSEVNLAYFLATKAKVPGDLLIYRPSTNMPEASELFLADQLAKTATTTFMGTLPALKVFPCPKDCDSSDYRNALKRLIHGYEAYSRAGSATFRGVMPVEVRWFNVKSMLNPMGTNQFGISFVFEGKLISLGKWSIVGGNNISIGELAEELGERLATELLLRAGTGLRPAFLTPFDEESVATKVVTAIGDLHSATKSLFGGQDVRSRMEPVDPSAHQRLLPAVDGILPGEVRPIDKMKYIGDF